jgi:hypothetical protein
MSYDAESPKLQKEKKDDPYNLRPARFDKLTVHPDHLVEGDWYVRQGEREIIAAFSSPDAERNAKLFVAAAPTVALLREAGKYLLELLKDGDQLPALEGLLTRIAENLDGQI